MCADHADHADLRGFQFLSLDMSCVISCLILVSFCIVMAVLPVRMVNGKQVTVTEKTVTS